LFLNYELFVETARKLDIRQFMKRKSVENISDKTVLLNLCKHAKPLRSFPSFCRTTVLPNITESKNGLLQT